MRLEIAGDVETERETEDLAAGEPLHHSFGRVLLAHAEFLPQHVGERAVGHAATVGQAATEPKRGSGRQALPELADEARLPHACLTHNPGEPRAPVGLHAREQVLEPLELALATDEPGVQGAVPAARSPRRAHPPELPAADAAVLSLRLDGSRLAELERAADQGRGPLPDEHVAGLRRLFEPRGHVHRVAGRERAALARAAHRDLTGIDADPQRQPAAEELLQPLLHPESDLQRPLGVILLGGRRTEHGDDRVADELLDRSAAERDLRRHRVVEAVEQVACMFGIERRAELRRADEVGEQDRRELALHRASESQLAARQERRPKICRKNRKMLRTSMKMAAASGIASSLPARRRRLKSTTV